MQTLKCDGEREKQQLNTSLALIKNKVILNEMLRFLGSLLKNSVVFYLRKIIIQRSLSTEVLQMEPLWCGSLKQLVFTSRDP